MTTIRLILLLLASACILGHVRAAESVSLQGILITASNEKGGSDGRLTAYEPTLRKILRFESYRFLGDDRGTIGVGTDGQLALGDGHQLEVTAESADGKSIHVRVRWLAGGRTLMNTGLVLRAGVPAVLGGPATGNKGEVYAVILIGR